MPLAPGQVTELRGLQDKDSQAASKAFALIYNKLRRLATHYMRSEKPCQSIGRCLARAWLHHEIPRAK
jgi:hypothetical protein